QHRNGQRTDTSSAFVFLDIPVVEQGDHSTDPGGDGNAQALTVNRVLLAEPISRVLPGLHCGNDGELRTPVEPARLDAFQYLSRIGERRCRDLDGQLIGPVGFDLAYPGLAG